MIIVCSDDPNFTSISHDSDSDEPYVLEKREEFERIDTSAPVIYTLKRATEATILIK